MLSLVFGGSPTKPAQTVSETPIEKLSGSTNLQNLDVGEHTKERTDPDQRQWLRWLRLPANGGERATRSHLTDTHGRIIPRTLVGP